MMTRTLHRLRLAVRFEVMLGCPLRFILGVVLGSGSGSGGADLYDAVVEVDD